MTSLVIGVLARIVLIIVAYLGAFYLYERHISKNQSTTEEASKALEL